MKELDYYCIHENEQPSPNDASPQQISGTQEPRASSNEDVVKLNESKATAVPDKQASKGEESKV